MVRSSLVSFCCVGDEPTPAQGRYDNIKMDLTVIGLEDMNSSELAQDKDPRWAVMTVMSCTSNYTKERVPPTW
jgi:hypothetical protein